MQHNVKVVALAGKAGFGKTTISKMILEQDPRTQVTAFAAPLKDMLRGIFHELNDFHLKDPEGKQLPTVVLNGHTPRELMQFFGTDFVRKYDPNLWVKLAEQKIEAARRVPARGRMKLNFIVFDDCRFENEVEMIRKYDGCIIHLERPEDELGFLEKTIGRFRKSYKNHASEAGVRQFFDERFDYVIDTSEPLTLTKTRVERMVAQAFTPDYQL
jgi:hypothetical protein